MKRSWWNSWSVFTIATVLFVVVGFAWVLISKSGDVKRPARYGQVDIPGSKTVALPKGSVNLILESDVDEGASLKVPSQLTATVTAVDASGGDPSVKRDVGGDYSENPPGQRRLNGLSNSYRRVYDVDVPAAGEYKVTAGPPGIANPNERTLDVGHAPKYGQYQIWARVLVVYLVIVALWFAARMVTRVRRPGRAPVAAQPVFAGVSPPSYSPPVERPSAPEPSASDHIEQLERLAKLHEAGQLTDAEFAAEKAKLLS
jgi:hypothetical protein